MSLRSMYLRIMSLRVAPNRRDMRLVSREMDKMREISSTNLVSVPVSATHLDLWVKLSPSRGGFGVSSVERVREESKKNWRAGADAPIGIVDFLTRRLVFFFVSVSRRIQ